MLEELESRLGYTFNDRELLRAALTHRSHYFENKKTSAAHNERLEFLGDAVLDLLMSESLMKRFPDVDEGTLSKWRASLVNEKTLSELAAELGLSEFMFLGKSEARGDVRPRLLASTLEALLAAVYLDSGIEPVRSFVDRCFASRVSVLDNEIQYAMDFKTRLQELTQKKLKTVPGYRLLVASGPEHAKRFRYEVLIEGLPWGEGEGSSRKAAEQAAAQAALNKLNDPSVGGEL